MLQSKVNPSISKVVFNGVVIQIADKLVNQIPYYALRHTIKPGITAKQNEDNVYKALQDAGFVKIEFNKPSTENKTDVIIGCHSVGDWGHGTGPSIAFFNPVQLTYVVKPANFLSIELFAYTAMPEWGGSKLRIPLEDDAIVTERGVEWVYPINQRVLLIK